MNFRWLLLILFAAVTLANSAEGAEAVKPPAKVPDAKTIPTDNIGTLIRKGWKLPPPPYPKSARYYGFQGQIVMGMSTDAKGQILKASILKVEKRANSASLRSVVLLWALYHWSGPPNSKATVTFEFRLR